MNKIEALDTYQQEVLVTTNKSLTPDMAKLYTCGKLCEESAEVLGPIFKHIIHGKPLNPEDVKKELGDALFYIGWIADIFGFKLSDVATENIRKLRERHGNSYNKEYYTGTREEVSSGC
jgi:NTP pyrophosphatase (non-canonical NTP hydrolase)